MSETRKLAAILCSDVVGYSRLAGADEDRILARLRALRSDLIDPTIAVHHGRVVKRTGDGAIVEFRSVVDAVRCAIEVQNAMVERNAGVPEDRRIVFRIGIHLGDVVEESDGDLMGDGVNIAARLEGIAEPGAICLSEDAYRQVKGRLDLAVTDLGPTQLKNIAEPVRAYSLEVGVPAQAKPATAPAPEKSAPPRLSIVVLPFTNLSSDPGQDYFADGVTENLTTDLSRIRNSFVIARNTAFTFKGKAIDAKQIGKELGVRYVLEGSVQRDQNRVRVNAQLIDGETGAHLWADRFQEDVADLFKLQDQVVARLANALSYELVRAEAESGGPLEKPRCPSISSCAAEARSSSGSQQPPTKDDIIAVRALFEQRSRSTRTMPMHWPARRIPICTNMLIGWTESRNRLRRKNTWSGRPSHRARARQRVRLYSEKHVFDMFASPDRGPPRRRRRARHQSKLRASAMRRALLPKPIWASSNKRNPMFSKPCA